MCCYVKLLLSSVGGFFFATVVYIKLHDYFIVYAVGSVQCVFVSCTLCGLVWAAVMGNSFLLIHSWYGCFCIKQADISLTLQFDELTYINFLASVKCSPHLPGTSSQCQGHNWRFESYICFLFKVIGKGHAFLDCTLSSAS